MKHLKIFEDFKNIDIITNFLEDTFEKAGFKVLEIKNYGDLRLKNQYGNKEGQPNNSWDIFIELNGKEFPVFIQLLDNGEFWWEDFDVKELLGTKRDDIIQSLKDKIKPTKIISVKESKRSESICYDCGKHGEFYFIKDELWNKYVPQNKHIICLKCLEKRMGRKLKKSDFKNFDLHKKQPWWNKIHESVENNIQQPVFLSTSDYLYVSDDFAKFIAKYKYGERWKNTELYDQNNKDFFAGTKSTYKGKFGTMKPYKVSTCHTNIQARYSKGGLKVGGVYAMNIYLRRFGGVRKTETGNFKYYIDGISGDFEMHSKGMVRSTRNTNLNFLVEFFPCIKNIKNFYKRLRDGELFFDIIENELNKNPNLLNSGLKYIPKEIEQYPEIEMKIITNKYNL